MILARFLSILAWAAGFGRPPAVLADAAFMARARLRLQAAARQLGMGMAVVAGLFLLAAIVGGDNSGTLTSLFLALVAGLTAVLLFSVGRALARLAGAIGQRLAAMTGRLVAIPIPIPASSFISSTPHLSSPPPRLARA